MKSYEIENTPELIEHIMSEQLPLSDDNVKWILTSSPRFAKAFKEKFPNFTTASFIRDAVQLLTENGFAYKIRCFTENRTGKYACLYSIEMYIDGEWEWESETRHETNLFTYWMNDGITDFDKRARKSGKQ